MRRLASLLGKQGARVLILLVILATSGLFLGLAAGYPLSKLSFEQSDAVRLDQARLAGQVDATAALVNDSDLPIGWEPGDSSMSVFGLLGAEFCGEKVEFDTPMSDVQSAVFANPADSTVLIVQSVKLDRWQSARDYVDDVASAVSECSRFYRSGPDGARVEVQVQEGSGSPPITDHVSRRFVAQDGSSVQSWSMMAVGDVVISILYSGPARPQEGFLSTIEERILARVAPKEFAPDGVAPTTTTTVAGGGTGTTVLEGGAADETEATLPPEDVDGGEPGN
ncbi:MAG: hypothetical protein V9E94_07650 [Microthrixaceae bacterium]